MLLDDRGLKLVERAESTEKFWSVGLFERHLDLTPAGVVDGSVLQGEGMDAGGLQCHGCRERCEVDTGGELFGSEVADGLGVDCKRVSAGSEAGELEGLLVECFVEVGGLDCNCGERIFCIDRC